MFKVGVDLGGTNIAVGVVDEKYNIVGKGKVKTNAPRPAEEIFADIKKAIDLAVEDAGITMNEVESVGVGTPGSVNQDTGMIEFSNNLAFNNVPAKKMLEELTGKPCYFENDANAAALGEAYAGAGHGAKNFVAVTLGTGVGSGIIVDGKVVSGINFAGGEMGHTVIVVDGKQSQHCKAEDADARQNLRTDGDIHIQYGCGRIQVADIAVIEQNIFTEICAAENAEHCKENVCYRSKAFKFVQETAVDALCGAFIAVAHVDKRDRGNHEHAALETAARGQMAVKDNVEHIHEDEGDDLIRTALDDNVALDLDVIIFHFPHPPFSLSSFLSRG